MLARDAFAKLDERRELGHRCLAGADRSGAGGREKPRLLASAFGLYPSSAAAFSTLRRIFAETDAPSVKVRDTAERDTPARSATSFNVTGMVGASAIREFAEGRMRRPLAGV